MKLSTGIPEKGSIAYTWWKSLALNIFSKPEMENIGFMHQNFG